MWWKFLIGFVILCAAIEIFFIIVALLAAPGESFDE